MNVDPETLGYLYGIGIAVFWTLVAVVVMLREAKRSRNV